MSYDDPSVSYVEKTLFSHTLSHTIPKTEWSWCMRAAWKLWDSFLWCCLCSVLLLCSYNGTKTQPSPLFLYSNCSCYCVFFPKQWFESHFDQQSKSYNRNGLTFCSESGFSWAPWGSQRRLHLGGIDGGAGRVRSGVGQDADTTGCWCSSCRHRWLLDGHPADSLALHRAPAQRSASCLTWSDS